MSNQLRKICSKIGMPVAEFIQNCTQTPFTAEGTRLEWLEQAVPESDPIELKIRCSGKEEDEFGVSNRVSSWV